MNKNGCFETDAGFGVGSCHEKKDKKGRKKKYKEENGIDDEEASLKHEIIQDHMPVVKKRKKIDRFNGMPEEEVILRTLPDQIVPNLDILIIGINPGLIAAYIGHHYAGPGNHFWKCLYLSGLVPEPMNCYDDVKVQQYGIGFTNMCARTTKGSSDLKRQEVEEGGEILRKKLRAMKPKIAVFNGKGIYEIFSGNKKFTFGKQPGFIEGTQSIAYVMPSSSARCAQLPRAIDKVPFYEALRRLRDYVVGHVPHLNEADVTFPTLELKIVKKENKEVPASRRVENSGAKGAGGKRSSAGGDVDRGNGGGSSKVKKEGKRGGRVPVVEEEEDSLQDQSSLDATSQDQFGRFEEYYQQITQSQQPLPQVVTAEPATVIPPHYTHITDHVKREQDASAGSFYYAALASLPSSVSTASPSLQAPLSSLFSSYPEPNLTFTSSQDFMSGFYSGSQQFGMVGLPSAVASHVEDYSASPSVSIKSEPAELDVND